MSEETITLYQAIGGDDTETGITHVGALDEATGCPHQFVQSRADDHLTTTLLSLPACPAAPLPTRRHRR